MGRALGFAVAWCAFNDQDIQAEHMAFEPSFESRHIHRFLGRLEYGEDFAAFEARERPRWAEEETSEPEGQH